MFATLIFYARITTIVFLTVISIVPIFLETVTNLKKKLRNFRYLLVLSK